MDTLYRPTRRWFASGFWLVFVAAIAMSCAAEDDDPVDATDIAVSDGSGTVGDVGADATPVPYGACTLPQSTALAEACSSQGGDGTSGSCVVDFVFECESQLCGTYEGSDPFCTSSCDPTAPDCPGNGVCLEWVSGLDEFYCAPPVLATR